MAKNKKIRLILMVVCTSLASQIYVNMFIDGFIVALSVLVMGVFLYMFKDINCLLACCLIAFFSPLFRFAIMVFRGSDPLIASKLVLPDVAFFFAYALFFGIVFKSLGYNQSRFFIRIALCDFLSNMVEMGVRMFIFNASLTLEEIYGLILLAVVRSFVISLICMSSDIYVSLLEKTEHEKNYKSLLLMASSFKSEVYFMEKNMNEIEDVMKNAFTLYKTLSNANYPKEYQDVALEISKDIHEIKKGYQRTIKGLEENFINDFKDQPLSLGDILKILSYDVEKSEKEHKIPIKFGYSFQTNYIIEKHFSFMSILRNLVLNSIDAIVEEDKKGGHIFIKCIDTQVDSVDTCIISVTDDGPGIPDDIKSVLFEPGFSTKMNFDTGDINRGLGLTLVRDLLEDQFQGEIEVSSQLGHGTEFTMKFPSSVLSNNINSDT